MHTTVLPFLNDDDSYGGPAVEAPSSPSMLPVESTLGESCSMGIFEGPAAAVPHINISHDMRPMSSAVMTILPHAPPSRLRQSSTYKKSRGRATEACDFCRGRRIKCSGEKPSCYRCERRLQDCTWTPTPSAKARQLAHPSAKSSDLISALQDMNIPHTLSLYISNPSYEDSLSNGLSDMHNMRKSATLRKPIYEKPTRYFPYPNPDHSKSASRTILPRNLSEIQHMAPRHVSGGRIDTDSHDFCITASPASTLQDTVLDVIDPLIVKGSEVLSAPSSLGLTGIPMLTAPTFSSLGMQHVVLTHDAIQDNNPIAPPASAKDMLLWMQSFLQQHYKQTAALASQSMGSDEVLVINKTGLDEY